ncbi:hypothetical protein [Tautonia sociabilis]|uniref:Uncharacterized protein n=1 Tax=Tautonia sociabilis TaxID=2080755 RepID=A0A432MMF1_9BACT|nr:hypothetical protein [Tautonia sociabilis]RUL88367.1 hypothetical protein TsocGM_07530 [Tautonia sociabilis]
MSRPRLLGPCLPTMVAVGLAGFLVDSPCRAQFNGSPFDPFRAAYRTSSYPVAPSVVPGQVRTVTPPGLGTVPGIGQPYDLNYTIPSFSAPRGGRFDRLDEELFGPLGDPYSRFRQPEGSEPQDDEYSNLQEQRRQVYLEATDPRTPPERRAELMREYEQLGRRADLLGAGISRRIPGGRSAPSRSPGGLAAAGLPSEVRSFDDLVLWARRVNREAIRAGVVRPGSN